MTSVKSYSESSCYWNKCNTSYRNKNNHICNNDESILYKLNILKKLKNDKIQYNVKYFSNKIIWFLLLLFLFNTTINTLV